MSESESSEVESGALRARAEASAAAGEEVFERVRDLTAEALRSGRIDPGSIRKVVEEVTEGVKAGAERHGGQAREVLEPALRGVDEALQKSAAATRLAIEEAASKMEEFTEQDLKQAVEDLKEVEKIFLETVTEVARRGGDTASEILRDLVRHAQNTGTAVGEQVSGSVAALQAKLPAITREGLRSGAETTRVAAEKLARIAGGFLAGLADALQGQERKEDAGNDG